jgi:hypothetical protein
MPYEIKEEMYLSQDVKLPNFNQNYNRSKNLLNLANIKKWESFMFCN